MAAAAVVQNTIGMLLVTMIKYDCVLLGMLVYIYMENLLITVLLIFFSRYYHLTILI